MSFNLSTALFCCGNSSATKYGMFASVNQIIITMLPPATAEFPLLLKDFLKRGSDLLDPRIDVKILDFVRD